MSRRLLAALAALVLILVACGDDSTSETSSVTTDPDVTVPDVVGESEDFARGALESVGLQPDVIPVEDALVAEGTVLEQVPAPGETVAALSTVVIKVAVSPPSADTTLGGGETTTSTSAGDGGATTSTAAATTTTVVATTTTAATTTTVQVGLTQEQCEDHPYYEPRSDPNCSRAEYRLVVNQTTSPRVWQCMSDGHGVYYNQDQPQNLGCEQKRNAPNLYFQANPPAPPYPDYDPTIGTVDTFIECSWKDAQAILDGYDNLSQANNTVDGWQWLVSNDNEVCIGR